MAEVLILPIFRLIAWTIGLVPWPIRRAWAHSLAFVFSVFAFRAEVVERNLELAFPKDTPKQRRERRKLAYRHLAHIVLEIFMLFGPMKRYVRTRSELRGKENWRTAHDQGKGVIFLASHVGNWEIMAATGVEYTRGESSGPMKLMLVTKHLKPEWLHRAIEKARAGCGVGATYEPKTMKDVLRALKHGETVGIVLDQYAGPPIGVRVPVFGVPVGTSSAIAMLAKRTGAVVLPVVNYRTPSGGFVVEIKPPLSWETQEDSHYELATNTARYAQTLEKDIYAHPEQWLWTHRRFKGDLSPLGSDEWMQGRARPRQS